MHDGQEQEGAGGVLQLYRALLSRDPSQRPSMERICRTCDRVLDSSTSMPYKS